MTVGKVYTTSCQSVYILTPDNGSFHLDSKVKEKFRNRDVREVHINNGIVYLLVGGSDNV